jgi:hypothetical protein
MIQMILAAQMTVYVGGLVVLVPEKYEPGSTFVDLMFLRGDCPFFHMGHHHNGKVGDHEPYLVAKADDLHLEMSSGYTLQGGSGADQFAYFPLTDKVSISSTNGTVDIQDNKLAEIGAATPQCPKPLRVDYTQPKWPVAARLHLKNAVVKPDRWKKAIFVGPGCDDTDRDMADLLKLTIKVDNTTIEDGHGTKVVFKTADPSFGIWNLPEGAHHGVKNSEESHFGAYYSVLADRGGCGCVAREVMVDANGQVVRDAGGKAIPKSSETVFCPQSRTRGAK